MEKKKSYLFDDERCTLKQKYSKCCIPIRAALFCLDCFTIHIQRQCPNCLSINYVRLIELFLSEPDPSDEMIEEAIRKKFIEI